MSFRIQQLKDGARAIRDFLASQRGVEISNDLLPEDVETFYPHYRIVAPVDGEISIREECINVYLPAALDLSAQQAARMTEFMSPGKNSPEEFLDLRDEDYIRLNWEHALQSLLPTWDFEFLDCGFNAVPPSLQDAIS